MSGSSDVVRTSFLTDVSSRTDVTVSDCPLVVYILWSSIKFFKMVTDQKGLRTTVVQPTGRFSSGVCVCFTGWFCFQLMERNSTFEIWNGTSFCKVTVKSWFLFMWRQWCRCRQSSDRNSFMWDMIQLQFQVNSNGLMMQGDSFMVGGGWEWVQSDRLHVSRMTQRRGAWRLLHPWKHSLPLMELFF